MGKTSFMAIAALICISIPLNAAPIQWTVASGGNGNWYEIVFDNVAGGDWELAKQAAYAAGGHLVTITSDGENTFVYSLIWPYDSSIIVPHLGAYQPSGSVEPNGGWSWVTGEPFTYTNWALGEPNNYQGIENFIEFTASKTWNDTPAGFGGYVLEIESSAVPEPSTLALLGIGIVGLIGCGWKHHRR